MGRSTVELDDQALRAPQAVDLDPAATHSQRDVELRPLELRGVQECQEAVLQLAASDPADQAGCEQGSERRRSGATRMAFEKVQQRQPVPEAAHLGLVDRALETVGVEHQSQVEERAGDGGDRDAPLDRDLVRWQRLVMEADRRARAAPPWGGHVDDAACGAPQPPHCPGGAVAGRGPVSPEEDGRHERGLLPQGPVPQRIDAAMDRVKPTPLEATFNRLPAQPDPKKLAPRNHTMLAAGQLRQHPIDVSLPPYVGVD